MAGAAVEMAFRNPATRNYGWASMSAESNAAQTLPPCVPLQQPGQVRHHDRCNHAPHLRAVHGWLLPLRRFQPLQQCVPEDPRWCAAWLVCCAWLQCAVLGVTSCRWVLGAATCRLVLASTPAPRVNPLLMPQGTRRRTAPPQLTTGLRLCPATRARCPSGSAPFVRPPTPSNAKRALVTTLTPSAWVRALRWELCTGCGSSAACTAARVPKNSAQLQMRKLPAFHTCTTTSSVRFAPHIVLPAGMKACAPCPGGTYPTKSVGTLPGNDRCTRCTGSTYRSVSSTRCAGEEGGCVRRRPCFLVVLANRCMAVEVAGPRHPQPLRSTPCPRCSATCDECLAGRETHPASNTMCIPW